MYRPLIVPRTVPTRVTKLIVDHADMQFHDVHCMLCLPMPGQGIDAGCDFAAANTLLALVAGASVVLYKPERFSQRGDRGALFKELLESPHSWLVSDPDGSPSDTGERLYHVYRNTLAHTFGVQEPGRDEYKIVKHRDGLTEKEVMELEGPGPRPGWLRPTIERKNNTLKLNVEPFYWGVRRLFENLLQDGTLMGRVDTLLKGLESKAQQLTDTSSVRSSWPLRPRNT